MQDFNFETVAKKSISGIVALVSRTFLLNLISLATFFVITSILHPSEIGIYSAVLAIQRVIAFFTDVGFGAALIQKKEELEQKDIASSFTIQAVLTLAIFLIVLLLSNLIKSSFKLTDAGERLLLVLVFTLFLSSFKTIPSILLERKINFKKLIIPQVIESLVFNSVLIILVVKGFGIDSFSWAFLLSALIGIPAYYFVSPWKIELGIHKKSLSLFHFGIQFQAKSILATLKDDMLTVIILFFHLLSLTEIGYISFAQRLAFFVFRYIVDSITKVTFSAYARIQHDVVFMKKAIEKSIFYVACTMFPMLAGVIIIAPYLISYYPKWHGKWEPAIVSLVFFCLNAAISSISGILVNVLDATGKVKVTLRLMVIWTALTWILTPIFIFLYGFNGVSIASFLVTLTIFYTIYLVKKSINFIILPFITKPILATLCMSIVVFVLAKFLVHDMLSLILVITVGGVVYLISLFLLSRKEILQAVALVR